MKKILLFLIIFNVLPIIKIMAQEAPGAPGLRPTWSSAKKVHLGTSYEANSASSPLWFTSADGILTEVYFPQIDKVQIRDAQILVTDGKSFFKEEKQNLKHSVQWHSSQNVDLVNSDESDRFQLTHSFFTFHDRPTLIDEITINAKIDGLQFFLLVNPALNNYGYEDSASFNGQQFQFSQDQTQLDVWSSCGLRQGSVGFVGTSDGHQDISQNFRMINHFSSAKKGNVAGTAQLDLPQVSGQYHCYIVYDFSQSKYGSNNKRKKKKNFNFVQEKKLYLDSWQHYLDSLNIPQDLHPEFKKLYYRSFYVMKSFEDKSHPGAFVASLSIPWGEGVQVFNQNTGGYHLVWPRDLYQMALAFYLAGDRDSALRSLRYLKSIQYQKGQWEYGRRVILKKGAMPQNVWVSGQSFWDGFQVDQVGYGVLLFAHLYETARDHEKVQLKQEFSNFLKLSLDFLKMYGPWTAQDRWEENFGISPSSFAVVAAALRYGEKIFPQSDYLSIANSWLNKKDDNIITWTFTRDGHFGDGEYFVRIAGCQNYLSPWNPNDRSVCSVANSSLHVEQTQLVDQGFLLLSLLGLVPANDFHMVKSWEKVNSILKVDTPKGAAWHRYTFDAYGENAKGRLWPIFASEQGRYLWELYEKGHTSLEVAEKESLELLQTFLNFSNSGYMIPEQVFENSGLGTGSATPLAWSHAEFIKLLWSHSQHANVEKSDL